MAAIEHIHGGNIREAAEKYGLDRARILDFSANINPLGPSPRAKEAITANLDAVTSYPDAEAKELRQAVAEWTGLAPEMISAGNGAVEIIYLLMKVLHPAKALVPAPTFNEYEIAVRINGGEIKDLPLDEQKGYALDKDDIYTNWADTDILFICNPNNPTGYLSPRQDIEEIVQEAARLGKTVVVDEAFMDFVADRRSYSVMDLVPRYDNLFISYSLTKFFAVPGLRLGLGLGHPGVIRKINQVRDPWNVNCFAQLAGIASLKDRKYINETIDYVQKQKDSLYRKLQGIEGLRPFPPSVNYIFINVRETGYSSTEVTRLLGRQGVLVRDCSSYKNLPPYYIRVAVRTGEENDKLIQALRQLGRSQ